jgi:ADP-ribose pyrophosphatase YjhB (NUDIX family)
MLHLARCPHCQGELQFYKNPKPTVDAVIDLDGKGIVLVRRRDFPYGWALPGGYVEYGESVEEAAKREALEETGLEIALRGLLGVYSAPGRDPRGHTIAVVFVASATGMPQAGDDTIGVKVFASDHLPAEMAFDHASILQDYLNSRLALKSF